MSSIQHESCKQPNAGPRKYDRNVKQRRMSETAGVFRLDAYRERAMLLTGDMISVIEETIRQLRVLDDREGGNEHNLQFVLGQLALVTDYLEHAEYASDNVHKRLVAAAAQLRQLAGWLAHDAEQHTVAQQHFRTALDAARSIDDRALAAHILGFMTYQAAYRGEAKNALKLARNAREVAKGTPLAVRSLIAARDAMAQATAGNVSALQRAMEESHELISHPGALDDRPDWLYWWDTRYVKREAAFVALHLEQRKISSQNALLLQAETSLKLFFAEPEIDCKRDALYHGIRLSHTYLWRGEVEQALSIGRYALTGLQSLPHPRSLTQLRRLDTTLGSRLELRDLHEVTEFRNGIHDLLAA